MIDSFANPNEIQYTNETFGVGNADKIRFNAPENSFQTITVTGEAFDVKIITPGDSNNVDQNIKGKADAEATEIYATTYSKAPEFYNYFRTLETYKTTLDENTLFILSTDNKYLKFIEQ